MRVRGSLARPSSRASVAATAAERAVSGRRAPGIATTAGERSSSHASATSAGLAPCASATSTRASCRSSRRARRGPAERRMRDQGDTELVASLDDPSPQGLVVVHAEGDLYRSDRSQLQRLVELMTIDVGRHRLGARGRRRLGARAREPRSATVFADLAYGRDRGRSAGRRARRGSLRSRRESPSRGRRGTTPPPVRVMPPFVTIRARPSAPASRRPRASSRSLWPSSVRAMAVGASRVEDGDARFDGRRDRREGEALVAILVGRQPHAAETDA